MSAWIRHILVAAAVLMLASIAWSQDKAGELRAPAPQSVEAQEKAPEESPPKANAEEKPAATPQAQPPQRSRGDTRSSVSSSKGWQPYRVIVDRNIFSRSRTPGGSSGDNGGKNGSETQAKQADAAPGPPPEPGTQVVLIGVSFVGDYATAVFEDRRDGAIYAAQVGEKLVDRTIQAITLDSVEVDHEGKTLEVVIGRTLAGTEAPSPQGKPAGATSGGGTSGSSGSASSSSTEPASDAAKAILERLRAKRDQELKK